MVKNLDSKEMNRIVVTATGGGVGQSILKALKGSDYEVIALDGERLGAGLYMVPESYLIPYATDNEYLPFLLALCKEKKIDLLFPGMDCELLKLSEYWQMFQEVGTKVVISNPDIVRLADDKLATQEFLHNNKFPFVKTEMLNDEGKWTQEGCFRYYGDYILKPLKGGARSKNTFRITGRTDRGVLPDVIINETQNYVIQEYIEGDEYTCGTVTLDGIYRGCIVMRRILRDGDTYKAFVERNPVIEDLCEKICTILKPYGAFNIQLRLRDGVPYVFEFNARCSGTTAARALAGFNEPLMIADYFLKGKEPEFEIKEINILRYWNELVVEQLRK